MEPYSYANDGLGSTMALTDLTPALQGRYSYDAWGTVSVRYGGAGVVNDRFPGAGPRRQVAVTLWQRRPEYDKAMYPGCSLPG